MVGVALEVVGLAGVEPGDVEVESCLLVRVRHGEILTEVLVLAIVGKTNQPTVRRFRQVVRAGDDGECRGGVAAVAHDEDARDLAVRLDFGKCTDSQIGTARTTIIALHYVPGHWCCATADLANRQLVYYDPFYTGPDRARVLNAQSAYVDQVTSKQGTNVEIGAAKFEQTVYNTHRQPDNISCGVCVLIEI